MLVGDSVLLSLLLANVTRSAHFVIDIYHVLRVARSVKISSPTITLPGRNAAHA